jgi:hypothetical protein
MGQKRRKDFPSRLSNEHPTTNAEGTSRNGISSIEPWGLPLATLSLSPSRLFFCVHDICLVSLATNVFIAKKYPDCRFQDRDSTHSHHPAKIEPISIGSRWMLCGLQGKDKALSRNSTT